MRKFKIFISFLSLLILTASALANNDCVLIDCDCDGIEAGLLTGPWRQECFNVETSIRNKCYENNSIAGLYCSSMYGDLAWPLPEKRLDPNERVPAWTQRMQGKNWIEQAHYYNKIRPQVLKMAEQMPELLLMDRAASGYLINGLARKQQIDSLYHLRDGFYADAIIESMDVVSSLDQVGSENPAALYDVAKWTERLGAFGIGTADLIGEDPSKAKLLEKAAKWARAALTYDELRTKGEINAAQFVEDTFKILPGSTGSVLDSPVGKFFRDLMNWDQKMWSNTTEGLNLVADAIETGNLNQEKYSRVANEINRLGNEGPWTWESGRDFLKKTAEGIPVVGKFLKAIWG
ncbi:MAG: hypothetical protein AB7F43_07605 [Bacteriovoracia bacterium]